MGKIESLGKIRRNHHLFDNCESYLSESHSQCVRMSKIFHTDTLPVYQDNMHKTFFCIYQDGIPVLPLSDFSRMRLLAYIRHHIPYDRKTQERSRTCEGLSFYQSHCDSRNTSYSSETPSVHISLP